MKSLIPDKSVNLIVLALVAGWMATAGAASPAGQLAGDCRAAARLQYGSAEVPARVRLLDIRGGQWAEGNTAKLVVFPPEGRRFTAECSRDGGLLVLSQAVGAGAGDHVANEQTVR